jgi:hypothetical protein
MVTRRLRNGNENTQRKGQGGSVGTGHKPKLFGVVGRWSRAVSEVMPDRLQQRLGAQSDECTTLITRRRRGMLVMVPCRRRSRK